MTKPNYLVTGAGGGVGGVSRQVVDRLLAAGQPVRAMVHREDGRAETLRGLGADVVVGDLRNPVDVAAALQRRRSCVLQHERLRLVSGSHDRGLRARR